MSHYHHSPLPPPPLPSGGYPLPPPLPSNPLPPPLPSNPPPSHTPHLPSPLFPSPSPLHHSEPRINQFQPQVLRPSDRPDYTAHHRDRLLYMDTPGAPPAINYGNELSRERLPYSQVSLSDRAPLSDSKDDQAYKRPIIDFTSDCVDEPPLHSNRQTQMYENHTLSSADSPPWLRRAEGHSGAPYDAPPFQHRYPRPPPHFDSYPPSNYRDFENPPPRPPNYGNTLQYPPPLMGANFRTPRPARDNQWSHSHSKVSYHQLFPSDRHSLAGPLVPKIDIETVSSEKLFDVPGRKSRPSHIVIVLRGLPGSGKSHLAKIIRDKEVGCGSPSPRILALDSYFLNEAEKIVKDPETGRRVKRRVEEYEFDAELEPSYRNSLFKSFSKTLDEGFFPMVIVDAVHEKICHFDRYWSAGKMKGFQVYIVELEESVEVCVERNIHNRTKHEIEKLHSQWDATPPHFTRLDVTALLSDTNIDEVEMECTEVEGARDETNDVDHKDELVKSRWDDPSEDRLDKLDAISSLRKRRHLHSENEEDEELEKEGPSFPERLSRNLEGESGPAKKRVRWADLEAEKEEKVKQEIGFVIGSGWNQVSKEEADRLLEGDNQTTS